MINKVQIGWIYKVDELVKNTVRWKLEGGLQDGLFEIFRVEDQLMESIADRQTARTIVDHKINC